MEVERQCVSCKKIIIVNSLNIKQRLCSNDEKKNIMVTLSMCESCGTANILQLDDENTMNDMRKLTTLIVRRAKDRHTHKRNLEEDRKTKEALESRIERRRAKLVEENRGKTFYERGGKILVKSLDM